MATILDGYVHKGWKVFVGADQVGEVSDVGQTDIVVKRGSFLKKEEIRVPVEAVAEAADGVVDLRADPRTREMFGLD